MSEMKISCPLCQGAESELLDVVGSEAVHSPYNGAVFYVHKMTCGHYVSVFASGKFQIPNKFGEKGKPGDAINFYKSYEEVRRNNMFASVESRIGTSRLQLSGKLPYDEVRLINIEKEKRRSTFGESSTPRDNSVL